MWRSSGVDALRPDAGTVQPTRPWSMPQWVLARPGWRQFFALLEKNYLLKRRNRSAMLAELLFPLYFTFLLSIVSIGSGGPQTIVTKEHTDFPLHHVAPFNLLCAQERSNGSHSGDACLDLAYVPDTPGMAALAQRMMSEARLPVLNVQAFSSDKAMLDAYVDEDDEREIYTALVVDEEAAAVSPIAPSMSYTIRVNGTVFLFEVAESNSDPNDPNAPSIFPNPYIDSMFLSTQAALLSAHINEYAVDPVTIRLGVQRMPLPSTSRVVNQFAVILPLYFMYSFIYSLQALVIGITDEKVRRLRDGMRMMGLGFIPYWASHATMALVIMLVAVVMLLAVSYGLGIVSLVSPLVMFLLFSLYAANIIVFGFWVTTLFDKPQSAAVGGVLIQTLSIMLFFAARLYVFKDSVTFGGSLLSVSIGLPFALGLAAVTEAEAVNVGITLSNMNDPRFGAYTVGLAILWQVLDLLIYAFAWWYCDKVLPSEYGIVVEDKLFFLRPGYWSKRQQVDSSASLLSEDDRHGVVISGLRKVFPKGKDGAKDAVVAVDELDLKIHMGEIMALLGHNGAGKSTTISMLCGMTTPTAGSAYIMGHNIRSASGMDQVRSLLGVCPQQDILWDKLTGAEHLRLFSRLKGVPEPAIDAEIATHAHSVGLQAEAETKLIEGYSGGMKRKLSLAIAFIGDSKFIFLDECTSGMDPYSRHQVWDLLQTAKTDKCIILSTHNMEEADLLADRISVLKKGKLQVIGTSLQLKNHYGLGYHLHVITKPGVEAVGILSFVKKYIPAAERERGNQGGFNIEVRLPLAAQDKFPSFLAALEERQDALGIVSFGMSVTTLEEVFLRLAEESDAPGDASARSTFRAAASSSSRRARTTTPTPNPA